MTRVFADSFFYIALLNPDDQFHTAAREAAQSLAASIVTTGWVLVEVADALSRPGSRKLVRQFINGLASEPNTRVVFGNLNWFDSGLALYGSRADKSWSLTDCISFSVMNELGLTDALTGDHHFEQAGFRALLKPG